MNKNQLEALFPKRPQITSPTHESRWQKIIANQESIGLQKEILHLRQKSEERDLSDWELRRLDEVQILLAQITNGSELPQ